MNASVPSTVRPLTATDIPAVAAMFADTFLRTKGSVPPALEDYLASVYLDAPWADPEITSLVHQRQDGTVTGFIGVVPMPYQWRERRLRAAVCGALMVSGYEADPMAGARLIRRFLSGVQDLSLCETASPVSLDLWGRLKGVPMVQHSMTYLRVLRPLGYLADGLRRRTPLAAGLALIAGPIDRFLQRMQSSGTSSRWSYTASSDARFTDEPLHADTLIELLPKFMSDYDLHPSWSAQSISRLLADASIKPRKGPMIARLVRSINGEAIGAYIYHGQKGGIAQVFQIFATRRHAGAVTDRMFSHAADAGMVAVRGRTEPHFLPALLARQAIFVHNAASTVHSRDPEIMAACQHGNAFFNGVAGETWSRLIGDDFNTTS